MLGLVYNYEQKESCPLVGRSRDDYNPQYFSNSIAFWKEVFEMFPAEKEMYMEESKKLRRKCKRNGNSFPVFS